MSEFHICILTPRNSTIRERIFAANIHAAADLARVECPRRNPHLPIRARSVWAEGRSAHGGTVRVYPAAM
jgi:hypothetical protein